MAYPYTPAFIAFCSGAPVEEIAAEFKISLASLKAKMWQEGWRTLANRMSGRLTAEINPNEKALAKIEANRAQNYQVAAKLGDHVELIIDSLRAGTLKIQKHFHYKGQVIEYEAKPSIYDMVSIAIYAKTVSEMSYRALGDQGGKEGYRADAPAGTAPPSPPVSIILPGVIARPRSERGLPSESGLIQERN